MGLEKYDTDWKYYLLRIRVNMKIMYAHVFRCTILPENVQIIHAVCFGLYRFVLTILYILSTDRQSYTFAVILQ